VRQDGHTGQCRLSGRSPRGERKALDGPGPPGPGLTEGGGTRRKTDAELEGICAKNPGVCTRPFGHSGHCRLSGKSPVRSEAREPCVANPGVCSKPDGHSSACDQKLSSTKARKARKTDDELAGEQRGGCERSPGACSRPDGHSGKCNAKLLGDDSDGEGREAGSCAKHPGVCARPDGHSGQVRKTPSLPGSWASFSLF
jgi:hypothetical protein